MDVESQTQEIFHSFLIIPSSLKNLFKLKTRLEENVRNDKKYFFKGGGARVKARLLSSPSHPSIL